MSIIVYSPEEMVIIADRFVMHTDQIRDGVADINFENTCKIHTSEDNHFAYCFEVTEEAKFMPVILNFLKRFESGLLEKDEKLNIPDKPKFTVGVMSHRHFYVIDNSVKNKVTIQHTVWSNHYTETLVYKAIRLPALKIWQTIHELTGIAHSLDYDIVRGKSLTPIKKAPKAKKEKQEETAK